MASPHWDRPPFITAADGGDRHFGNTIRNPADQPGVSSSCRRNTFSINGFSARSFAGSRRDQPETA
ncbi:hypothetical protein BV133_797 [Blastochloris viridis]|uniref:Uncharacterized protein n=1 Tax=Blastochloris viridis TaxID=1079 RepID=A0A182CYU5_BLAVI|nr:hypothetical protein BV133_797 [Blastochloris viridis]